jgi:hypothetical protein
MEMELIDKLCIHFIAPEDFRLNDLFLLGDSNRTPSAFDPPLDKALTWATSLP